MPSIKIRACNRILLPDLCLQVEPLFYHSLPNIVRDSYKARAYWLSFFITASNIVGPAVRVLVLAAACAAPKLGQRWRLGIARVANFMGRFVFAQAYILSLLMLVFRINLDVVGPESPVTCGVTMFKKEKRKNQKSTTMIIAPDWWGWWGCIACATFGQLASILVLAALSAATPADRARRHQTEPMAASSGASRLTPASVGVRVGVAGLLLAACAAIAYGSTLPAFFSEFKGVVGLVAETTGSSRRVEPTCWSSVWSLPSPHLGHPALVAFVQAFKVVTAFVAPLLEGTGALLLWTVPMPVSSRSHAIAALEGSGVTAFFLSFFGA